jgi:hypothetical protein
LSQSTAGVIGVLPNFSTPVASAGRVWIIFFAMAAKERSKEFSQKKERSKDSGGSSNQTLWGQLVDTVGPSHISYSKILLVSSKPVGPGGPTAIACIRH